MASGKPSSCRQMPATAAAFSLVSAKSGFVARALNEQPDRRHLAQRLKRRHLGWVGQGQRGHGESLLTIDL